MFLKGIEKDLKKVSKKLFRNKKGCMFAAAKNGSVFRKKVHSQIKFFSFKGLKKNQKKIKILLWESKKGFIFAPA